MCFSGTSYHNLDSKGRLAIPARFRDAQGAAPARLVLRKGMERNLVVHPYEQWAAIVEKLNALPQLGKKPDILRQFFIANSAPCECDRQGRILLPPATRQILPEGELAIVGMGATFEIWNRELWDRNNAALDIEQVAAIAEELGV